jgi:hypothetical protein
MVGSVNEHFIDMAQLNLFEGLAGDVDQNTRSLSPGQKNKKKKTTGARKMSRTKEKPIEINDGVISPKN